MLNNNSINILYKNIYKYGININFYRKPKNAYGEINVDSGYKFVKNIKGIFHEDEDTFNSVIKSDMGRTESEKKPAIFTDFSNKSYLKIDDVCNINGTKYRIISFQDVDLSNKFIDVSLELIFDE